ncbi:uncharacterized protein LOC116023455 [Ipomoea triloba]|uniref:uncharacterized protein LOC116023455 n=1 Tax=Ipomoea triloba TaxID=35885 RepID=UPI00125D4499|nr:uncharacterized protein LOC116023455 [Ipomoea triloba]
MDMNMEVVNGGMEMGKSMELGNGMLVEVVDDDNDKDLMMVKVVDDDNDKDNHMGTVIHANIPKDILPKFLNSFVEGDVYCVKNFFVVANWHTYKTNLIGRVVQIYAPQQKTIGTRLIDFVIEDSQGNRLTCTFWDEHVAKIEPFYQSPGNEPLYVLIQFCRLKIGVRELSQQTPMRSIASMSSITDLYDNEQFGDFWIAARINGVENPSDWFYISCPNKGCNKKLKLSEGVNKCFKCNKIPEGSITKYKIRVRMVDMKGTASFLLCDRECMDLLGLAAEDLYERNVNNLGHIKEIFELVGRTMLFKISAKKDQFVRRNIPFPILRINTDHIVLQQHCPDLLSLHENDCNSECPISEGDDKFLEGFESDEAESPVAMLAPTSSTDCTTDGPVKRCLLDSFSSTKGGKKVKQCHVKLEKID